jgi:pyruvate kinase
LSAFRPRAPIVGITPHEQAFSRLQLWWGVLPLRSRFMPTTVEMIQQGEELLKQRGLVESGQTVLMLAGQSQSVGATNMLRVHTVS